MPYKKGDVVEIVSDHSRHGFPVGTVVTVTEVGDRVVVKSKKQWAYKVDHDESGKKRSRYVSQQDLVKRIKRKDASKKETKTN